ncbi:hypothetical protein GCM10022291_05580 [Postechiella marina]|uniref:Acyltransferase 3 domain-containing protein n=1 Tax=Postechiella marina TaxID=943941 RepID=A0ABP8C1I9_9FLAO
MGKQLPNLYAIRFILAILVVIHHIPETSNNVSLPSFDGLPLFHKGKLAVLYFFTLSGFLIIRLIYLELSTKKSFDFKNFYLRRVQRLYPVYYLVLIIGFTFYNFILPAAGIPYNIEYPWDEFFIGYVFLAPNVIAHYYKVGGILNILWSIGVEEQFYLFAPFLIYLGRRHIILTLSILLTILVGIALFYFDFYAFKNYYFYFVCGGLFAVLFEKFKLDFFKNKIIHITVYGLFIISFLTNYLIFESVKFTLIFNMVLSALFISLIAYHPLFIIKSKPLNYFGKISYGIYMYHMIALVVILYFLKKIDIENYLNDTSVIILINAVCIAAAIYISHLSYKYFEKLFYKPKY